MMQHQNIQTNEKSKKWCFKINITVCYKINKMQVLINLRPQNCLSVLHSNVDDLRFGLRRQQKWRWSNEKAMKGLRASVKD